MSKIVCNTPKEFYDAIEACVQRGLIFNAYTDGLYIELTGGF